MTTLALLLLSGGSVGLAARLEIEVVHWWIRGGDASALRVIIDEFESRGGTWSNAAEQNFSTTRESVVSRMAKGYPPTAIQWNAGEETREFARLGLLNTIKLTDQHLHALRQYHPAVIDAVTLDGELIGLPVNLHSESWMWGNRELLSTHGLRAPTSWSQLIDIAEPLRAAGVVPVALGSEPWQLRILFNDLLLGFGGEPLYTRLYRDLDTTALDSLEFDQTLDTLGQLRSLARSFGTGSWDQQVAAVGAGQAAVTFMGDWAKGEFVNLGHRPGVDIDCLPAPATEPYFLPVIDVLMLGRVSDPRELEGQQLLIDSVQDPDTLYQFNRIKGSLPPYRQIDSSTLDLCSRKAAELISGDGKLLAPFASFGNGEFAGRLQAAIMAFWVAPDYSKAELRRRIAAVFKSEQQRRSLSHSSETRLAGDSD